MKSHSFVPIPAETQSKPGSPEAVETSFDPINFVCFWGFLSNPDFFFFHLRLFDSVPRADLARAKELFLPSLAQFKKGLKWGLESGIAAGCNPTGLEGSGAQRDKIPSKGWDLCLGSVPIFWLLPKKTWKGSWQGSSAPASPSTGWTFLLDLILNKRRPNPL